MTKTRRTVLLLPALYSEFEGAAMPRIVEQLKGLDYLYRIVLSLDRATEPEFKRTKEIMSVLPGEVRIVWHDGPRLKKAIKRFTENPVGVPLMAAWVRIHAAIPDFTKRLQDAVEIDNE